MDTTDDVDVVHLRERTWRDSHGAVSEETSLSVADESLSKSFEALLQTYRQPIPREFYEDYEQQEGI